MPTYEYECRDCGNRFERFQSMSAPPLRMCPECGGKVRRLIGAGAGVIFKGSGFHANDYGSQTVSRTRCGKDKTCCGREVPCSTPPCDSK
jgi:putative FmdB family regulatory protein